MVAMRHHERAMSVAAVVAATLFWAVPSMGAPKAPKVTLVGGAAARTINLLPCTATPATATPSPEALGEGKCNRPYLMGSLALGLKNVGSSAATMEIRFIREDDGHVITVPNDPEGIAIGDGRTRVRVSRGATTVVPLVFVLTSGQTLAALSGRLTVTPTAARAPTAQPVSVSVSAVPSALDAVTVQPSTVVISDPDINDGDGTVDLVGPGVRQLLAAQGAVVPHVRLAGPEGDVTATLGAPTEDAADPDRATAKISLSSTHLAPGKYVGVIPIWPLRADGPKLPVEVDVQHPWWTALLLLMVGTLIGGVAFRLAALARRRALLREVLDESLAAYKSARGIGDLASYDLDGLVEPAAGASKLSPRRGADAVRQSIAGARTSADLDQDAARVLDLVARMQRWLRIEPAARRLRDVAAASPTDATWRRTRVAQDTALLLMAARSEPLDAAAADTLVSHLLRQARFQNRLLALWRSLSGSARTTTLNALYRPTVPPPEGALVVVPPTVLERTVADQDAIDANLDTALLGTPVPHGTPGLPNPAGPPGVSVAWDASPSFFTGWATLDAKSFGQIVSESRVTRRSYKLSVLWSEVCRISLPDALVLLGAVGIGSLAYFPTLYTDTWGSATDLATAFLAGLLGHVVVNWAALPAFQSLRLTSTSSA
jgi:hypothetical protein